MKQHTDWVKARIQSIPIFAVKTFVLEAQKDAQGKLPKAPFALLHPVDGIDTEERYTGPASTQHPRFTLHIVGSSYDNVATVTALVKPLFIVNGLGVIPVIPGERPRRVWWHSPLPIQLDRDVTPPIPFQVVELGFTSDLT